MRRRDFARLVQRALEELPPQVRQALENVAIVVQAWPGEELVAEMGMESPLELFGLYQGTPLVERQGHLPLMPDRIVLFQGPIEAACASEEQMVQEVKTTVLHEVGHYLGMGEEELDRLGYG